MTENEPCVSCRKPKSQRECDLCFEPVCKSCVEFLKEGTFPFWSELPEELQHSYYCSGCHQNTVQPALDRYQEILDRAKTTFFFFNTRKKPIQTLARAKDPVKVEACVDRDETILRLGFMAATQGFNAVVEAVVEHAQVRNHGWQKTSWSGSGVPAKVDAEKLDRLFLFEE